MSWKVPNMWADGDVWIMGGGPSIPEQFGIPNKVVQKVMGGESSPAVYAPYMEALYDKHVIGINMAYKLGDWIDMIFFGDGVFFLQNQGGLADHGGLIVSCHPSVTHVKWVKYLERDKKHFHGISGNPSKVSWNNNSGAAAISVAANAGAKRIILLGFDMSMNEDNAHHWHNLYKKETKRGKHLVPTTPPFKRHLKGFPSIERDARQRKIEILNASPKSKIEEFKKVTVKELL